MIAPPQHDRTSRARALARAWVVALCLGATSLPAAAREDVGERVDALLERSAAAEPAAWTALARELADLGDGAVGPCLERLLEVCEEDARDVHGASAQVLVLALERLPRDVLRARLGSLAADAPSTCARRVGLRLIERTGRAEDVLLATRLATPAEGAEAVEPALRLAYARALAALAARDPANAPAFAAAYQEAHPALVSTLVGSLGRHDARSSRVVLARLLGRREGGDALLLIEIGRLGALPGTRAEDDEVRERVRACLDARRREVACEAAVTLARLGDTASVPRLVALAAAADDGESVPFERALTELCGGDHGPGGDAWQAWHAAEVRWWWEAGPALLADLSDEDPAAVARALKELAQHPLYRHEIGARLPVALHRAEPELSAMACAVAGALGSVESIPALLELARAPDPRLRRAARGALSRLRLSETRRRSTPPNESSSS